MRDKKQKKIEKYQKKIEKFTKKLQKYRDLLTELTTDDVADTSIVKATALAPALTEVSNPRSSRRTAGEKTKAEANRPTRTRTRTGKTAEPKESAKTEPVAEKTEAAPAAGNEAEKKPTTRVRKPRAASAVKKPSARRKDVAVFALYNCDEEKSQESMYNRDNETFRDTQLGRRGLWAKLKTELAEGRIELLDGYPIRNVRLEIESGKPETLSPHLKYGFIGKVGK